MGVGTVFRRDSARRRVSGCRFGSSRPSGGCFGAVAGAFCAGQCQDRLACGLNRRWKVAGMCFGVSQCYSRRMCWLAGPTEEAKAGRRRWLTFEGANGCHCLQ